MKIKTKIDEYSDLLITIAGSVRYQRGCENSYKEMIQVLLSNIQENKDELILLYKKEADEYIDEVSSFLASVNEREKTIFNLGMVYGLCDFIKNMGRYEESLERYLKPYMDLEVGDVVYMMILKGFFKTEIIKKDKKKIQVKYKNLWFTQDDYLNYIFPYSEKENLIKSHILQSHKNCDKCNGFKQGKCIYGYSVSTTYGSSYGLNDRKYKGLKGKPKEYCYKKCDTMVLDISRIQSKFSRK